MAERLVIGSGNNDNRSSNEESRKIDQNSQKRDINLSDEKKISQTKDQISQEKQKVLLSMSQYILGHKNLNLDEKSKLKALVHSQAESIIKKYHGQLDNLLENKQGDIKNKEASDSEKINTRVLVLSTEIRERASDYMKKFKLKLEGDLEKASDYGVISSEGVIRSFFGRKGTSEAAKLMRGYGAEDHHHERISKNKQLEHKPMKSWKDLSSQINEDVNNQEGTITVFSIDKKGIGVLNIKKDKDGAVIKFPEDLGMKPLNVSSENLKDPDFLEKLEDIILKKELGETERNEQEVEHISSINVYKKQFPRRYNQVIDKIFNKKYKFLLQRKSKKMFAELGLDSEELKGINPQALFENLIRREILHRNNPNNSWIKDKKEQISEFFQDLTIDGKGMDSSVGDLQIKPSVIVEMEMREGMTKEEQRKYLKPGMGRKELLKLYHEWKNQKNNQKNDFQVVQDFRQKGENLAAINQIRKRALVQKKILNPIGGVKSFGKILRSLRLSKDSNIPVNIYINGKAQEIFLKNKKEYKITIQDPNNKNNKKIITLSSSQMRLATMIAKYQGRGLSFASKDPKVKAGSIIPVTQDMIFSPKVIATVLGESFPDEWKSGN